VGGLSNGNYRLVLDLTAWPYKFATNVVPVRITGQ
jgi:hypothetical protein